MARRVCMTFIAVVALIVFFASVYHFFPEEQTIITVDDLHAPPLPLLYPHPNPNYDAIEQEESEQVGGAAPATRSLSTVSILLPAWEILVVVSPETPHSPSGNYTCLFPNNDTSPAKPSGILPSPDRVTFKCELPARLRRRLPFLQPILTKSPENLPERVSAAPELLRWNFLVYDTLSMENDVILFVKGINNRQGINRAPNEFRCMFGDNVRTAVTSSFQEVFRCQRPEPAAFSYSGGDEIEQRIKVSLEISTQNLVVPSVAYYTRPLPGRIVPREPKSVICACTMVYNAAKFLKEWVVYHSEIGVDKFILYDNDSSDGLERVVDELVLQGYNVSTLFWLWPKTQEAGFSHCAMNAKDTCRGVKSAYGPQ